jgi:uncharacterized cupin superfamily protein
MALHPLAAHFAELAGVYERGRPEYAPALPLAGRRRGTAGSCQDDAVRRFNVLAPAFDHSSERDGYRWRGAAVRQAVGAEEIGARLYELADGQRAHPYHFHHGIEEWLLVVAGTPRLRTPDGERVLRSGDLVCFPVGPGGAHEVSGPGTVLLVSTHRSPDAIEYPDRGEVELRPPGAVFRTADSVERWDEE